MNVIIAGAALALIVSAPAMAQHQTGVSLASAIGGPIDTRISTAAPAPSASIATNRPAGTLASAAPAPVDTPLSAAKPTKAKSAPTQGPDIDANGRVSTAKPTAEASTEANAAPPGR